MRTPKLMLHCGANEVQRNDLNGVVLPPSTDTFFPIGHNTLVDMVQDKLDLMGYRFGAEAHSLTHDGSRYFGLFQLVCGTENEQFALVAGLRNSTDKSFPARLAFGSHVFVCDNLAFSGEVTISRKHTKHIMRDLPFLVEYAVSQTTLMKNNQEARYEHYQGFKLTTNRADHIICEMVRRSVINTSRVQRTINEWDNPSYDHGGKTAWRLMNAVTETLKDAPLNDIPPRTMGLHSLMDEVTGFQPEVAELPEFVDRQQIAA